MSETNMFDKIMGVSAETFDAEDKDRIKIDIAEMQAISSEFPKDGIVDIGDSERLAGLCMRGLSICDYWIPLLSIIIGELETKYSKRKSDVYLNAEKSDKKSTAEYKKNMSESDDEYNELRMVAIKFKSLREFFVRKSSSFEKTHIWMKDTQKMYLYKGGRHINGEEEFKPSVQITKESKDFSEEDFSD